MTKSVSSRRAEFLLTTALVATICVPAAGQVVHSIPVIENTSGAAGGASVTPLSANTMLIGLPESQPRTIIRWDSFDIGANSSVSINGIYGGSARPPLAVLNRVTGNDSSDILGRLFSEPNISVFLINPNGILFGSASQVDVGALFASTLNITDADFLDSGDLTFAGAVTTGVSVVNNGTGTSGADLTARQGDIALMGAQVRIDPQTQVRAPNGTVFLAAANGSLINIQLGNYFTTAGSAVAGMTVGGTVSGRDVVASVDQTTITNALLEVTGNVTATSSGGAGGDVVLVSDGSISVAAEAQIGAERDVDLIAGGTLANTGTITAGGELFGEGSDITNLGSLTAKTEDVFLLTDSGGLQNGSTGTISAGGNVELMSADDLNNDGTVTAAGDVLIETDSAVGGGGSLNGRDVTTNGFTPSLFSMGIINARDDVFIRSTGDVRIDSITAGTSVGPLGPTDENGAADDAALAEGITLTGHDVDIDGDSIATQAISALGLGSDIHLWTDVSTPVEFNVETFDYFLDDLNFRAGGNIRIDGSASAMDVTMVAGGNLNVGNVFALDDIVLKAGGILSPGIVRSGVNIAEQFFPVDQPGSADAEEGVALAGHDIVLSSPDMRLSEVTANDAGSDISMSGAATSAAANQMIDLTAGGDITNFATINSDGLVYLTAAGNITNRGAITAGFGLPQDTDVDVLFDAGGDIDNSGAINTHDGVRFDATNILNTAAITDSLDIDPDGLLDIQFNADGDITNSGALTSSEFIQLVGVNITNSGAITAGVNLAPAGDYGILIDGSGDVVNSAALTAGDLIEIDGANITNSGAITSTGDVSFFANNDILDSSASPSSSISGRDIALRADGSVTQGALTARDDIAILAGSTVTTGSLRSGATVNGNGPVDVSGAADSLLDVNLAGHDIDDDGAAIAAGIVSASGTNSDIILRAPVTASLNDLDFSAGGNITINGSASGDDVAMNAGGALSTGPINAHDDIALRSVGALNVGQLSAGVAPAVDRSGSADALLGRTLAGHDISVAAPSLSVNTASALGTGSDLFLTATTGDLSVINLTVGGDVTLDALRSVSIGSLAANSGSISILADDLSIQNSLSGAQVTITNRAGGNALTALGDATVTGNSTPGLGAFSLTAAELNRITTPILTIDSLGQNLLIGNLALSNSAGSNRVNLLGTGRVDVIGQISASGAGRTLQLGGSIGNANAASSATLASVIRIAPTTAAGGRITFDGGTLDLRGAKIGVGLDDGFLTPLGLIAGGTPLPTSVVARDWVANRNSTLYGIPEGYSNPAVITAGTLRVTYADYALFQNTAPRGTPPPTGVNVGALQIISSGTSGQNSFGLFGAVRDANGVGAALVVQPDDVSFANSRVNGCLIVTGGGCGGGTADLPIPFNVIDSAEASSSEAAAAGVGTSALATQKLVSTDEERTFDFESLVGTNNEGLLDAIGNEKPAVEQCKPEREGEPCPVGEKPDEQ